MIKVICIFLAVLLAAAPSAGASEPQKVIIDTDMGNDVDDIIALVMAYRGVRDGKMDLRMISAHKKSPTSAMFIDMCNCWYGYPEIAVSYNRKAVANSEYRDYTISAMAARKENWRRCGRYDEEYPDAVRAYRELLACATDKSYVIVSLGFGTTLAALLDSPGDDISSYDGKTLVRKKVKYLSIMAGSYGAQDSVKVNGVRTDFFDATKKRAEYNVVNDIPSMRKVFADWPTPIIQNPFELGKKVMFPYEAVKDAPGPIALAYRSYRDKPYDRPSWDILSVLYVMYPEMFTLSDPVKASVDDKGFNHITLPGPKERQDRIMLLQGNQAQALLNLETELFNRPDDYLRPWSEGCLDIHSIGTGQGDCTFMVLPDGTSMMVDCGDIGQPKGGPFWYHTIPSDSLSVGQWVARYVRHFSPNPDKIDYGMLTHFHADHLSGRGALKDGSNGYKVAGLTEVGDLIPFGTFVDRGWPGYDYPSTAHFGKSVGTMPEYRQFVEWHRSNGMKMEQFNVGTDKQFVLRKAPKKYRNFSIRNIVGNGRVWTGKGTQSKVMNTVDDPLDFDENLFSCGFVLRYGDFTYYNCGDLGGGTYGFNSKVDRRQQDVVADVAGKITVMKPDHHGWKDCISGKFLLATRPDAFIVMGSQWQHPYVETLRRMTDPILLSGQRDVFITSESSRALLGEADWQRMCPNTGHIVVRVYPGGKTYQVFILDLYDKDYRVKYATPVRTVSDKYE